MNSRSRSLRDVLHDVTQDQGLERVTDLKDLVQLLDGQGGNDRPLVGDDLHKPLAGELHQRLANGYAADVVFLRQFGLQQLLPVTIPSGEDVAAQTQIHLLVHGAFAVFKHSARLSPSQRPRPLDRNGYRPHSAGQNSSRRWKLRREGFHPAKLQRSPWHTTSSEQNKE